MHRTAIILVTAIMGLSTYAAASASAQVADRVKPAAVEPASSKVIDGVTYYYDADGNPLYYDDPVHYDYPRRFYYRNGGWVMARSGYGHHHSRYANTGLHKRRGTAGQSAQPGSGTQVRKQVERRGTSGTAQAAQNRTGSNTPGKAVRAGRQSDNGAQPVNGGSTERAGTAKAGKDASNGKTGQAAGGGQSGSGKVSGASAASGGRSGNAGKAGSSATGGGRSGGGSKSASGTARGGGGNSGKSAGSGGHGARRGPK